MILDTDEDIRNRLTIAAVVQSSVDIFVECFDITGVNLMTYIKVHEYYLNVGKYDIDKVRDFYQSKEDIFRKRLKEIGLTVSIGRSYKYREDIISYTFYLKEKPKEVASSMLYTLKIYFEGKNAYYHTYTDLAYSIDVDNYTLNTAKLHDKGLVQIDEYIYNTPF